MRVRRAPVVDKLTIPSDLSAARQAENRVLEHLAGRGYSKSALFAIRLAVVEGLSNAIRHGNRRDPCKRVTLRLDADDKRAVITITDQGCGFRPSAVPDPTADENLEKPSGRGIMLMHAYMDEVRYNRKGNQIRMVKRNVADGA
jgi:serine/threonine-protein kinase RsbW